MASNCFAIMAILGSLSVFSCQKLSAVPGVRGNDKHLSNSCRVSAESESGTTAAL